MKAIISTLFLCLFLSACGGGGSSPSPIDSPPIIEPIAINLSGISSSIELDENTSKVVSLKANYNGALPLSYAISFIGDNNFVSITEKEGVFTFDTVDLSSLSQSTSIKITVTDGVLSEAKTINLFIKNNSLIQKNIQISNVLFTNNDINSKQELYLYLRRYLEQAYMLGMIKKSDKENKLAQHLVDYSAQKLVLHNASNNLRTDAVLANTDNGEEQLIDEAISTYFSDTESFPVFVTSEMNFVNTLGDIGLPSLSSVDFYNEDYYAVFVNNPNYGVSLFTNQEIQSFTFNGDHPLLTLLFPLNAEVCLKIQPTDALKGDL